MDREGKVGVLTSLTLDASDHPHISYLDYTDGDLKYAWYDGTTWHIKTVDSEGEVGWYSSLALDTDGNPHISYYDCTNYDLKYAWHDGVSWQMERVYVLGRVGYRGSSLALDASDHPRISYYDGTNRDLKYAYWGTGPQAGPVEVAPRPNLVEGWGRVDLARTLFPTDSLPMTFVDQSWGLHTGGVDTYPLAVVHTGQPLRVTLAWSDYPGSPAAAGGLVNDLDLVVTAPDGGPLYPTNASQRGDSQHLTYDDGSYSATVYRWDRYGRSLAVRFTSTAYPAVLDRAQFFLIISGVAYPYFYVRVLDDDGGSGKPGTALFEKLVAPVTDGWFTVDLEGITIIDGDFYVELYYVGGSSENPYLALDPTSPTGRSYVYDGSSWCVLPCVGAPGGNWAIRAVTSTLGDETEADRVNNLVGVDISNPVEGIYSVQVSGYNVPQGPQPYALVVSGPPGPRLNWRHLGRPLLVPPGGTTVDVLYGNISVPATLTATLSGSAVFADGSQALTAEIISANGSYTLHLKPAAGATLGNAFALEVVLDGLRLERVGTVAQDLYLPLVRKAAH